MIDEYVEVGRDLTIHYEAAGDGDIAVIFVPGWTMTTRVFEHQVAHLAGSDRFQAITYDPRGQGLSSKTAEGHCYEQHGRDLRDFIETIGVERAVLVGWSNGAVEALSYLSQFGSGTLAGLVMLDQSPKGKGTDFTREWVVSFGTKDEGDQEESFRFFSHDVLVDRQAFNVALAGWMLESPTAEAVSFVVDRTNQTSDAVAVALIVSSWWLDYSADLRALNDEALLLYIVRDELEDLATAWASTNTPAAKVTAFGKHMMFWERHEEFNRTLDQFLETVK